MCKRTQRDHYTIMEKKYMAERVTIQDIADALGLSRNTVSKAINNTGVLAESTRKKVIQKSIEMGYKQFAYVNSIAETKSIETETIDKGDIALFKGAPFGTSHFASPMLDKFQHEISLKGYTLTMHQVREKSIEKMSLPISFRAERTKAIICIELFDYDYSRMLCELGIPVLFIDGSHRLYREPLQADLLLMNNTYGIFSLVDQMARQGIRRIGFIGIPNHCLSFKERYMAFRNAMYENHLPIEEKFCLTSYAKDNHITADYQKNLLQSLKNLDELPELFICANDFVAIDVLQELRKLGYDCPKDILISGFDDSQESRIVTPSLTTCHIHSQLIGYQAAKMILDRIRQPDMNFRIVYTEAELKLRRSTDRIQ